MMPAELPIAIIFVVVAMESLLTEESIT